MRVRRPPSRASSGPATASAGSIRAPPRAPRPLDPFRRRRFLGPKGYRRPDDRVHDEVCERIARSGIDAREVEVAVQVGEVTLTGTALSREDKRALEDVVDDVFGVEDVHNRLTLARPAAHHGRGRRRERGDTH